MTNDELKKWLRDNSSGVYRPSRIAADVIEQQEREIAILRGALRISADRFRHESVQWLDAADDIERILPNAQDHSADQ